MPSTRAPRLYHVPSSPPPAGGVFHGRNRSPAQIRSHPIFPRSACHPRRGCRRCDGIKAKSMRLRHGATTRAWWRLPQRKEHGGTLLHRASTPDNGGRYVQGGRPKTAAPESVDVSRPARDVNPIFCEGWDVPWISSSPGAAYLHGGGSVGSNPGMNRKIRV